ncbi:OmpA family protein [Flavobacterium sp. J372]|uniref:OmpA family protein n=1 Tax=Flavobacterium sp. J372 TaxID=2898436 RepID=UPI002150BE3C|nr:OmpA family protein [Flavobacterium sp. J372]MCR5860669.1 OmpA family protein [Flavobacterium sp. J372]MCR5861098.1 OmpA family protein [Flavobacterium sp. J372]MCR5863429.1 OmpA family protein [Flavobacterium sp. J372]
MKNIYISLGMLLSVMAVSAQNKDTEQADKLYERLEYVEAADAYLKLAEKSEDPYVYRRLADSYYNVFNSKEAVKWYPKAIAGNADAELNYNYAQMLKAEGRYDEANKQMQQFAAKAPNDQRAIIFKRDPDYLPKLRNQEKLFDEKLMDINDPKYSSFGGVLTNDNTLYFTSARNTARKTYGWNEQPYLDIYTATYNANGTFSAPTPVAEVNSKWHDGPVAVTADGNTMYFSSESFKEKKFERDRENNLKKGQVYLYRSVKENGKWGKPVALPFNDKRYSTGNPSISADGKTLYFVSDREGSIGGADIWKVAVMEGNTYGEPQNLGTKVNTEGAENFPFIADDGKLYFTSDGRKGFGAMDIFVIDLAKGGDAMNVGMPVNSPKDDFAFSINQKKGLGFFASNRSGVDQLYTATPVCGVEAIVMVRDAKTGAPLASAKVAILDEKNNVIETRTTGADGKVTYAIDCDRAYTVQASVEGYENNTFPIAKTKGGTVNIDASLNEIAKIVTETEVVLNDVYFEFDKSNITKEGAFELDKLVEALKANPNMVIMVKGHTDSRGSDQYNMNLSNRRAKSAVQYVISRGINKARISGQGYGESQPKVPCGDNCTEEQHAQNRRSEFLIVKK